MRFDMRSAVLPVLSLFTAATALADPKPLFTIQKPENPQNLVQTFVNVDANCNIGNVDFLWLRFTADPEGEYTLNKFYSDYYQKPAYTKPADSVMHCNVLKRLQSASVNPASKASCETLKAAMPNVVCSEKGLTSADLNKIDSPPALLIRSVKSASTGKCSVAAFADLPSGPLQISQVNATGSSQMNWLEARKIVNFSSIALVAAVGTSPSPWVCKRSCTESFGTEFFACR